MGERRALVIGSQCAALAELSFLPQVAEDLAAVLTTPALGGWTPALPDGNPLLLDPSVDEADQAIETAITRASEAADTLLLAFVGHGEHKGDNFYLLPRDAAWPPDSRRAVLLATRIQELLDQHGGLDGLVLLIDACHSGLGAIRAAEDWPATIAKAGGRFEMLTSADDREAADGCFTTTLVELLRSGEATRGESLRCADAKEAAQACSAQVATHLAFDGRRFISHGDPGLFLGRNPAQAPLAGTLAWGQVEKLTAWFERTPQLEELYDASRTARCVALVGEAGQGKSTLAAALARAKLAEDLVPTRYVNALAFAVPATTADDLARTLAEQLAVTVNGFPEAAEAFQQQTSEGELAGLGQLERQVISPLAELQTKLPIRLVVDGLDQLAEQAAPAVHDALAALVGDPALAHVRLIVTARPDTRLPQGATQLRAGRVADEHLGRYLRRRGVPEASVATITVRADGNWLVARLFADLAADGGLTADELPVTLAEALRQELERAGAGDQARWARQLRPVLAVLAVAGVGPVLPLPLLGAASGRLGGPDRPARVRDVLVALRGLIVRGAPGTRKEHVGVFHTTFARLLLADPTLGIDAVQAHAALADAIEQLAPNAEHNPADPLHRYAAAAEAEHLWAAGRIEATLAALRARASSVPAENRVRAAAWAARLDAALGPENPATLSAYHELAHWTGQAGDYRGALELFRRVLRDRERVLGPDDRDTLDTRHGVAYWTGQNGDPREALRLLRDVLAAKTRVLGADNRATLAARHDIAVFTVEVGDFDAALSQLREVLDRRRELLGENHRNTLSTRHTLAYVLQQLGHYQEAEKEYRPILEAQQRDLGEDNTHTLDTLHNLGRLRQEQGDYPQAQRLLSEVLDRRRQVLGEEHPATLDTRHTRAYVLQQLGRHQEAEDEYRATLEAQQRVLGRDNPQTLGTLHNLGRLRQEQGDYSEAQRLLSEVLDRRRRVLGPDQHDTLSTRHTLAYVYQMLRDLRRAEDEYRAILEVQQRTLRVDHPETLGTLHNLARLVQEQGDYPEAQRLLSEVLERRQRVLGPDHHDTLSTRHALAYVLQALRRHQEAEDEYRATLEAQQRTLGEDHQETLGTRSNLAALLHQRGDLAEARAAYQDVLDRRRRVLGEDHPDTRATREALAKLTGG